MNSNSVLILREQQTDRNWCFLFHFALLSKQLCRQIRCDSYELPEYILFSWPLNEFGLTETSKMACNWHSCPSSIHFDSMSACKSLPNQTKSSGCWACVLFLALRIFFNIAAAVAIKHFYIRWTGFNTLPLLMMLITKALWKSMNLVCYRLIEMHCTKNECHFGWETQVIEDKKYIHQHVKFPNKIKKKKKEKCLLFAHIWLNVPLLSTYRFVCKMRRRKKEYGREYK